MGSAPRSDVAAVRRRLPAHVGVVRFDAPQQFTLNGRWPLPPAGARPQRDRLTDDPGVAARAVREDEAAQVRRPEARAAVAGLIYGGEMRDGPARAVHRLGDEANRVGTNMGHRMLLRAVAGWTSLPWLWRVRRPMLVLAGDDDPIIPLANARLTPDARLHVYHTATSPSSSFRLARPGYRRLPERPGVASRVERFWESCQRATASALTWIRICRRSRPRSRGDRGT